MSAFSTTARLMVRPFHVYARLASGTDASGTDVEETPSVAGGVGRLLLVLASFVAVTATGRFAPIEIGSAFVSFAWVPFLQAGALAVALRLFARGAPKARAFALYLEGQGPWLALFLAIAALCLFAPDPARLLFGIVPPLVLFVHAWSVLLTYALFRSGLELTRGRAAAATATYYAVVHVVVVAYFIAAGQLLPILPP